MKKTINLKTLLLFMLAAFLSGCGGGSGGDTPKSTESGDWDKIVWDQGTWK